MGLGGWSGWWSRPVCLAGKKGLPLFIKPRQIQLACGLPSNPINLLSCESTQQLLPISHFSQPLIRSAQDIQWGSLQLHLRCYSCRGGFKTTASVLISPSVSPSLAFSESLSFILFPSHSLAFTPLLHHPPVTSVSSRLPCISLAHHTSSTIPPAASLSLFPSCSYTETTKQLGQ